MIQTYSGSLAIYFGNKQTKIDMIDIKRAAYVQVFKDVMEQMSLESLIVLDQQHTSIGMDANEVIMQDNISLYKHVGDYLITDTKKCGLVVLTADCLPVVLHDTKTNSVGIAHAGWRGSSGGIVEKMLRAMQHKYQSNVDTIHAYYGVSAQTCCYDVGNEFPDHFTQYEYSQKAFIKRDNGLYFDNKKFTTLQLQKVGIAAHNIYNTYEWCTICHRDYCSARREREQAGRQLTVVALV